MLPVTAPASSQKSASRPWLQRISLVIFSLLMIEAMLQIITFFSPKARYLLAREQPRWSYDPHFGVRLLAAYPEHDRNGFRNQTVPKISCFVALGDSQTYGWKVPRANAWPQQLQEVTGLLTYNMGVPQYGPVQSYLLMQEALSFEPKVIIEGFYSGNDLFDSFDAVYSRGLAPELSSTKFPMNHPPMASQSETIQARKKHPERHLAIVAFFADHSRLFGFFRALKRFYFYNYVNVEQDIYMAADWNVATKLAMDHPGSWPFQSGELKTIFEPDLRFHAIDLTDPKNAEALRISMESFKRMNVLAKKNGARFFVVQIPTKEFAFKEAVLRSGSRNAAYERLVQAEEQLWNETQRYLRTNAILYVDVLPVLRAAIRSGLQPYPISANGHLNATGHKMIAKFISGIVNRDARAEYELCKSDQQRRE